MWYPQWRQQRGGAGATSTDTGCSRRASAGLASHDGSNRKGVVLLRKLLLPTIILLVLLAVPAAALTPIGTAGAEDACGTAQSAGTNAASAGTMGTAGTAETVYVEAGATGGNGSSSAPYGTIQAGVDNATPGATVIVRAGTYDESVAIEQSVHVVAKDGARLEGSGVGGPAFLVENTSHPIADVTIRGFAIESYDTGIEVAACNQAGDDHVDLQDVTIEENAIRDVDRGIAYDLVDGTSEGLTVVNNSVANAREKGIALFVHGSATNEETTIRRNDLSAGVEGPAIWLWAEDSAAVRNPTIEENDGSTADVGLEVYMRNTSAITGLEATHNRFSDTSEAAIEIATGGVTDATFEDARIVENELDGSDGAGLLVDTTPMAGQKLTASELLIRRNDLSDNKRGIAFELSEATTIEGVTIAKNAIDGATGSGNGIDVITRDDATMSELRIAENRIAGSAGDAVRLAARGGAISDVTIVRNELAGSADDGIALETHGSGDVAAVTIERNLLVDSGAAGIEVRSTTAAAEISAHYNIIAGNGAGVDNLNETGVVDARYNWWGNSTGPSTAASADSAPVADPVTGALADGDGDSVSEGATDGVSNVRFDPAIGAKTHCADDPQLHDPVPDQRVELTVRGHTVSGDLGDFLGLCLWERAPLPFASDHSDAANKVELPQTFLNTSEGDLQLTGAGTNRPTANVFQAGQPVGLSYEKVTGADTTRFAGEEAKLLVVRANATQNVTGTVSATVDKSTGEITLGTDAAAFVEARDLGQIDAKGSLQDFDVTPSKPGAYLVLVATVDDPDGLSVTDDGNLTFDPVRTSATVVGGTVLAVQETDSTVTPNRTAVEPGEAIEFEAASNLNRDDLTHALVLYDEQSFADATVKTDVAFERDGDILRGNLSGTVDGDPFFVRVNASTDGTVNEVDISDQLDGVDSAAVLVRSGAETETLTLDTGANWREGTYRWAHVAIAEDNASRTSTAVGTVTVDEDAENMTAPDVAVSPTSYDFGEAAVGSSQWTLVEVSNVGDGPLKIYGSTIAGADAGEFRIARGGGSIPLSPGESFTIKVRFEPTSAGSKAATLEVATNDSDESTATVALSGTGAADGPEIGVSPASYDFGEVDVGDSAGTLVEVSNDGDAPLKIYGSTIAGADEGAFRIARGGGSIVVAPGDSYTVKVRFEPTSAGSKSAALEIASNDTDDSPATVALSGTGDEKSSESADPEPDPGTETEDESESLSVDVDVSGPGNATVVIRNAEAGESIDVTFDDGLGYDGIALGGLSLEPTRDADEIVLELRQPRTVPDDASALGLVGGADRYVVVEKTGIADEEIADAGFRVRMTGAALDDRDPADVSMYRFGDGSWSELSTTHVERTDAGHVFRADAPGFSAFAVGVAEPRFEVTSADVSTTTATAGETVTVSATLENTGDVAGSYTARLTADGETVASRAVSLDAGESTTVEFEVAFDDAGEYDLAMDGTAVGTLSVEAATDSATTETTSDGTATATTAPGTTEPSPEDPDEPAIPLIAISLGILLVAALVAVALYFRGSLGR